MHAGRAAEAQRTLASVVPPDSEHEPARPPEPSADDDANARDELRTAMSGMRSAFNDLERTWDTGIREALSRLDDLREGTDQLAHFVADNLDLLQRITTPPRR